MLDRASLRFFAAAAFVLLAPNVSQAQQWKEDDPASVLPRALRSNVIAIRAQWKESGDRSDGFGFITGVRDGYTYIATANHVIRGYEGDSPADEITVRFFRKRKRFKAELVESHDATFDVGVLRVAGEPPVQWLRAASGQWSTLGRGAAVWFVGRSGTWYIPSRPGSLNDLDPEMGLVMEGLSVTVGTSGAPVLSRQGIVGLMTTDASGDLSRACPIGRVASLFEEWKLPWALVPIEPKVVPKSLKLSGQAYAEMARLLLRMGRGEDAVAATEEALRLAPNDQALVYWVFEQIIKEPETTCVLREARSWCARLMFSRPATMALKNLQKAAPNRKPSEAQLGQEVRVRRILSGKKNDLGAPALADLGLKRFPKSHWFLAEVGSVRAQKGDPKGLAMIEAALAQKKDDQLYAGYKMWALVDLGRTLEAGEWLVEHPFAHEPSQSSLSAHVCGSFEALIPQIDADKKGEKLPYKRLAAVRKRLNCDSRRVPNRLLNTLVTLRAEGVEAATATLQTSDYKLGELARSKEQYAPLLAKRTHQLLVETSSNARARFFLERFFGARPRSLPHAAWPDDPYVFEDLEGTATIDAVLTEPPTRAVSIAGNAVRTWRIDGFTPDQWVHSDSPPCALAASKERKAGCFRD